MSHLHIERLAALADETPTAEEQSHLATCGECAAELEAHRALLALAGVERESLGIPLTRWDSLSHRLSEEGLLGRRRTSFAGARTLLQVAASLLLVASGVFLGRVSAGAPPVPGGLAGPAASDGRVASSSPMSFASVEEARAWKVLYRDGYQSAVSFLAAHDSASLVETPAVMRARLSALDRVSSTMREALGDAPYDPVINDFYLNSFGQREATLRQLNTVLPQNVRLNSF